MHYFELFCRSLLLPSGEVLKSESGKILSTSQFDIRIALRSSVVNAILDMCECRKWRMEVSVLHQQVSRMIHGFHFSFIFRGEPIKLHGTQYLPETFEVLRKYMLNSHSHCSALTPY